jgi:hypothetical protein
MKKIKVLLNSIAILAAIGGAFATSFCWQCEEQVQYIPVDNTYNQAGEYGVDYTCSFGLGTCTYYYTDTAGKAGRLAPCREGQFTPVHK